MVTMKPKRMSPQALFMLTSKRSEYSDEIARMNKKEELMLNRQLKVFERQERVAQSILKKHKREAERLDRLVSERSKQSINLEQYDIKRATARVGGHSDPTNDQSLATVRLPALGFQHDTMTSQSNRRTRRSRVPRQSLKMMSMRAMKTGVMVEDLEPVEHIKHQHHLRHHHSESSLVTEREPLDTT